MFEFAENKIKLQRALEKCGKEATEADVREEYIRIGGRVDDTQYILTNDEVKPIDLLPIEADVESKPKKIVKKILGKKTKK